MTAYEPPTTRHGVGLLPASIGDERDAYVATMQAAYAAVLGDRKENFALFTAARLQVVGKLQRSYQEAGLTAPPFVWDALWSRVDLPVPSPDPLSHVELIRALMTDYQERFLEHLVYRLMHDGNVHLEGSGPTGMGKSSCFIGLADWLKPIPPARLVQHLSVDVSDLPNKLAGKEPGDTVIQDEFTAMAGEGARTLQALFDNLEDTLRASQLNLFRLSPRRHDGATMQAHLELLLWSPERQFSVFLVWIEDRPHGVIALPWASKEHYAAYKPWKDANVQRSVAGHFKDNSFLAKSAVALFADARFVQFMVEAVNKPKLKDFRSAIELFPGSMLSGTQADRMASFMHDLCYNYQRLAAQFEAWFGIEPNDGLEAVAQKCYED